MCAHVCVVQRCLLVLISGLLLYFRCGRAQLVIAAARHFSLFFLAAASASSFLSHSTCPLPIVLSCFFPASFLSLPIRFLSSPLLLRSEAFFSTLLCFPPILTILSLLSSLCYSSSFLSSYLLSFPFPSFPFLFFHYLPLLPPLDLSCFPLLLSSVHPFFSFLSLHFLSSPLILRPVLFPSPPLLFSPPGLTALPFLSTVFSVFSFPVCPVISPLSLSSSLSFALLSFPPSFLYSPPHSSFPRPLDIFLLSKFIDLSKLIFMALYLTSLLLRKVFHV